MSLVFAIIISSLLLSVIILFVSTKDRWNWGKLLKKITFITILIILALSILGYVFYHFSKRPKIQNDFWGINLNNTTEDVRFLKGIPNRIVKGDSLGGWDSVYCYHESGINSTDVGSYFVSFKDNKILEILYTWEGAPFSISLQGIGRSSDMKDIEKKFGKPDTTSSSEDGLIRFWKYYKYHVNFSFERGKVTTYGIHNPDNCKRN